MHSTPTSSTPRGTPSRRGKSPRFSAEFSSVQPSSSILPSDWSNKPVSTFASSLHIRVEGAVPIEDDTSAESMPLRSQEASTSESKRAPRKSKTEALLALNNHARSSSVGPEDSGCQENVTERYLTLPPIPVGPLDLSSVKTSSPRGHVIPGKRPRPFGLQDCPEFFPTIEEFKDPMAYIRSISDIAKNFGICKVIPPVEWKMPFVTDTESFRFKTRLQQLNSMEASSRAKLNFLEQLYRFHKQQGNPRVSVPTINHKPLDLWRLRKEVHNLGGYDAVTTNKKWSDLGQILGYRGIPGLSTQIKNSYTRVILPYEHFCERARNSPSMSPTRGSHLKTHTNIQSAGKSSRSGGTANAGDASPPSSPLTTTSSPLSDPPDESEYKDGGRARSTSSKPRKNTGAGSQDQSTPISTFTGDKVVASPVVPTPVFYDKSETKDSPEVRSSSSHNICSTAPTMTTPQQQNCEICHKKNRGEEMLLCDGCDCGFHMFCLDPPLDTIPKDQWFCYNCLWNTGVDFGFDDGAQHTLPSFQARDLEFRRMWFEKYPPSSTSDAIESSDPTVNRIGKVNVSEFDVETEFWRLVQSPQDTVEIEYGADVHSTTHGSAMPTVETHPLNAYSRDPWNLNNIPIVSDSLLRFIKSDISGMTVPWIYVGMVFSTFCWHNEDHYTYSVNFMHWGETKTWYGIPGEDAEKFEAAIKSEAPDLFEAQPDLLFQLVTLMNPKRITDAGVRLYACNQRAGEFVITYPKAYHAGFNHGFNFNEAVNFALPDWLPYGRDCVARYREHRKLPVFSHDELLITITQQSQSIKTAMWLIDSLNEMMNRETSNRRKARALGMSEIIEAEDKSEDQYQCSTCKTFCYLSQVTCQCATKVVCVDHADLLCDHSTDSLVLRKRFSDEELLDIQGKVAERAAIPSSWHGKLCKLLGESARPPLRSLRALLAEGERISVNYPLSEIFSLRKCVGRANEWVDAANTFLIRKQSRKRSRRSRGRPSLSEGAANGQDDPGDRPDRGLDELYTLIDEVENLGFDCPEIGVLQNLAREAEELKMKASTLLYSLGAKRDRDDLIHECERLLLEGSSLNVFLDQLLEIEKIVNREQLMKELEERLEDPDATMTLEEVRELLTRARSCNLASNNPHVKLLETRQRAGDDWEERARNILVQPMKTIDELEDFANVDSSIPIDPSVLDRLMMALAKAKDFDKQAQAWLSPEPDAIMPKVQDVMKLVARADKDFSIPSVLDLKQTADIALDLETRCEQVLRNRYRPADGEDIFETIEQWKTYTKDHLTMFSLPTFERLESQLKLHNLWVIDLPWYCREHQETHGQTILTDVLDCTHPDDDLPPNDEYLTCICNSPVRPPPPGVISDAVQCDHCHARFHGECAKNGGSCPFCDHHHWNGAIHKERSWHFCYLPTILVKAPEITKDYSEDWKQLEIIVRRVDRLSAVIGQFLSFTSQAINQRADYIHQVRHYMRKLYKIQFAVSPNPDVSFGLDLAGLHRILAGRPPLLKTKKRRRPRFTFGQDIDQDWTDGTRCICRGLTSYLLNYPKVECESCNKLYHAGCVFFPLDSSSTSRNRFTCPLCCLRKNRTYQYSEVRVKPMIADEGLEPDMYVNTKEMLDNFSKEIIYKKMSPPYTQTLFVELIRFQPGQPENVATNGSAFRSVPVTMIAHPLTGSASHSGSSPQSHVPVSVPIPASLNAFSTSSTTAIHVPPPPPWSRWGTMSTPSRPPSTQRRQTQPSDTPRGTPQPPKKRKHVEDPLPSEDIGRVSSTPVPSTKRRIIPQTLSPSLAMIVSPDQPPPRPSFVSQTPMRNGSDRSPALAMKMVMPSGPSKP